MLNMQKKYGATLTVLLDKIHLLYFIDIPILLILWYISRRNIRKKKSRTLKNKGKRRIILSMIYVVVIINITMEKLILSNILMSNFPTEKLLQLQFGSIYGYHIADLVRILNAKETTKYKTYEEIMESYNYLAEYYETNYEEPEELYGIAEGKNVIIIQLESMQNFVVNRTINGKEITPNLNKFLKENIEFTNMHVQSYSTTADSEYSVITSLYPLENGQAYSAYYSDIDNDIYSLYKNAGYTTLFFHGNNCGFWNRNAVYSRLDVDKKVFLENFNDTSEIINRYLSDELFYKQSVEILANTEEPFFAFLVASSSHTPFELSGINDKESKVTIDVGKYKDTYFGNYLESANYADYAFGLLIQELKEKGLYNDSVIIVFGDHAGLELTNEELANFIEEQDGNYNDVIQRINYTNLLCGLKIPGGVYNKEISTPVSKVDIKPTLLELSGINDNFSLGVSMFSTKDYAVINNGSIVTDGYYYNGVWYYLENGKTVDLDNINIDLRKKLEEYVDNMRLELDISSSILINNLFDNKF